MFRFGWRIDATGSCGLKVRSTNTSRPAAKLSERANTDCFRQVFLRQMDVWPADLSRPPRTPICVLARCFEIRGRFRSHCSGYLRSASRLRTHGAHVCARANTAELSWSAHGSRGSAPVSLRNPAPAPSGSRGDLREASTSRLGRTAACLVCAVVKSRSAPIDATPGNWSRCVDRTARRSRLV